MNREELEKLVRDYKISIGFKGSKKGMILAITPPAEVTSSIKTYREEIMKILEIQKDAKEKKQHEQYEKKQLEELKRKYPAKFQKATYLLE